MIVGCRVLGAGKSAPKSPEEDFSPHYILLPNDSKKFDHISESLSQRRGGFSGNLSTVASAKVEGANPATR